MEQEEEGEREEKEKNEFSCWPGGAGIDRVRSGAQSLIPHRCLTIIGKSPVLLLH